MIARRFYWLLLPVVLGWGTLVYGEDPSQFVRRAVQTELAKDNADHSHWLYFEDDRKPDNPVKQWVAETNSGNLKRIVQIDGHRLSPQEQRSRLEAFLADSTAQSKQRKGEQHDDAQATEMLQMLPNAFIWTFKGEKGSNTLLHFQPNPNFHPPDMQAKVFAAMEGDMLVDTRQMRIASLRGRLIRDVKFLGGLLGELNAGGSFDVERRETGQGVWQITETHVHIEGHALLFHTISEQEDDVKTDFKPLPPNITMQEAKNDLLDAKEGESSGENQVSASNGTSERRMTRRRN